MSRRRTPIEMAEIEEAKVRRAKAKLELEKIALSSDATKHRRKALKTYRAAQVDRFTADWQAPTTSADSAIVPDLVRVNNRARQLVRDDAWAKAIVRSFKRNVVGRGVTPLIDKKPTPFKAAWKAWSTKRQQCDRAQHRAFAQIQQWAIEEMVTVGQAFVVRWIMGSGINRRLVLECYEFEQLDTHKTRDDKSGNDIVHGIEVDEHGARVAYHFYKTHPNRVLGLGRSRPMMLESIRVPAEMVCHVVDPERAQQTHGISRFAPIVRKLRDLSEYDAAQLRAARAEAMIGFIVKGDSSAAADPLELDGLSVGYINRDEDITPFAPSRPGNTYEPFVKAQVAAAAAGAGTSKQQVTRDFSEGSYSSQRQTSVEDRREWEPLQDLLCRELCVPVMDDFEFVWAMKNPEMSAGYFLESEPEIVEWQGQGWEWVDPEAQGKGIERMMRLGLTSRTIEAQKLGRTVEQLDTQIAQDGTAQAVAEPGDAREIMPKGSASHPQPQEAQGELFNA